MTEEAISCKWRELPEFFFSEGKQEKKKGRYHRSVFPSVKHFGVKRWVVCGYIEVDHEEYLKKGYTKEEIMDGCLAHFNQTPPRKKYQKKKTKPLYGNLSLYSCKFKKDKTPYIEVILITDDKKNKYFWGRGLSF